MSNKAAWNMLKGKLLGVWLPVAMVVLMTVLLSR